MAAVQSAAMEARRSPLPDLVLWRSEGCHLCEEATELVGALLAERAGRGLKVPRLVNRRIADNPAIERELFEQIPVLEVAGRRLPLAIRLGPIRAFLDEIYGW